MQKRTDRAAPLTMASGAMLLLVASAPDAQTPSRAPAPPPARNPAVEAALATVDKTLADPSKREALCAYARAEVRPVRPRRTRQRVSQVSSGRWGARRELSARQRPRSEPSSNTLSRFCALETTCRRSGLNSPCRRFASRSNRLRPTSVQPI